MPYGLRILNTNIPTGVKDGSKILIDNAITVFENSENFRNIIPDKHLRTINKTPIDHFATTAIMDIKFKRRTKVNIKEIFDRI